MDDQRYKDLKLGERGAIISITAYIILSILKLVIGYVSNSEALRADGLNNATDIIASVAVLIGLRLSRRPPDKDHGYGHWKSETISSLVASFVMIGVGFQVLIEAVKSIFQGVNESPDVMAAYVGLFAAASMYFVYRYNMRLANKINSKAVMAAAKDNLSDAWVSVGTAIGIFGSAFAFPWLDTVTAFIVGLLICKTAFDIFRQASHDLTDGFDEEKIREYKDVILDIDGVKGMKNIRGRNYGNNEVIDVVILVDSTLDIRAAHDIATHVEQVLIDKYGVYEVQVHVEPN